MHRNHLAKDDLDWLPERYRLLRGLIVSGVWTGILGGAGALLWSGATFILFTKLFVVLGAAGYWAGDRVAKRLVSARIGKLARGEVDLARLSTAEDGELVHVRGIVRAVGTVPSLLGPTPGVYRRIRAAFNDVIVIDEQAVDFQLVDQEGHAIGIEVEGARWLVDDPELQSTPRPETLFPLAQQEDARRIAERYQALLDRERVRHLPSVRASEVMLRPGDRVEAVGYKSRRVDPSVVDRLARETPMRATLRSGKDLPLILSRIDPETIPLEPR